MRRETDGWIGVEVLRLRAERGGGRSEEGEEGEECEREEGGVWDEDREAHFVLFIAVVEVEGESRCSIRWRR